MDREISKKRSGSLRRRDMLKVISTLPAAAALAPIAPSLARQVQAGETPAPSKAPPVAAGAYRPKVLSEHEWKTVSALSDWIMPADESSGSATQAGVPEFIDDWLDFKGGVLLDEIRGGLTWLDLECNRLHQHDFVDSTDVQQKHLLDRMVSPETGLPGYAHAPIFFDRFRDLVVSGFFSSEMGVKDLPYMGNGYVKQWEGCPAEVMAKIDENIQKGVGLKLTAPQVTSARTPADRA